MKKIILITSALLGLAFVSQGQNHFVGEKYGGGIVFSVDSSGKNGLIAAAKDLSGKYSWQKAKDTCKSLRLNGFRDWYLPNKENLNKLYLNLAVVGGFSSNNYWSSSEFGSGQAWFQIFSNGNQNFSYWYFKFRVRAVRTFNN